MVEDIRAGRWTLVAAEDLNRDWRNPQLRIHRDGNDITGTQVSGPMTPPATGPAHTDIPPQHTTYPPTTGIPPRQPEKTVPMQAIIIILIFIMAIIYGIVICQGISRIGDNTEVQEDGEVEEIEMVEVTIYHMQQTDTIYTGMWPIGGEPTDITYEFPVGNNASRATINTTYQGDNTRPDIDLYICAPDGTEIACSAGATADESVELDYQDFERHGYGNYTAEIRNYSNTAITYEIEIYVYGMVPANQTEDNP
jgi:hypothetical protein